MHKNEWQHVLNINFQLSTVYSCTFINNQGRQNVGGKLDYNWTMRGASSPKHLLSTYPELNLF